MSFLFGQREAQEFFEGTTKALRAAEAEGIEIPRWLLSLAAGILEGNREGALSLESGLYLVFAFKRAYEGLDWELRQAIASAGAPRRPAPAPWREPIPDRLPVDIDDSRFNTGGSE